MCLQASVFGDIGGDDVNGNNSIEDDGNDSTTV